MTTLSTFTNLVLYTKQKADTKNIAIYSQEDNKELFLNVRYIDGDIKDDLKMMEHPREDGASIVDHVIDDAKTGNVKLLVSDDDNSSLNEILDCFRKRTQLVVKIKNEIFSNLCISSKPVKADVEHFNSTVYELSFKEMQVAITQYVKMKVPQVKQKKSASTVKTGQKKPQPQRSTLRSIQNRIFK